jgi:hypothetical protein
MSDLELTSHPSRLRPAVLVVLACLLGAGVIVGAAMLAGNEGAKAPQPGPAAKEKQADDEPPPSVSAYELWAMARDNALAAEEKFRGKPLRVTGTVGRVGDDNGYYVGLMTVEGAGALPTEQIARMSAQQKKWFNEGYPPNVLCFLAPSARQTAAPLKKGKVASIVGVYGGTKKDESVYKGYVVILKDCSVAP